MKTILSKEGEPVDLALWRAGRRGRGALEAAFDATRRLAEKPPRLPAGVSIRMPDQPVVATVKTVKLWD